MKKLFLILIILILVSVGATEVDLPTKPQALLIPETWQKDEGNAVLASADCIAAFNKSIISEKLWVWDLTKFPAELNRRTLLGYIDRGKMADKLFIEGRPLLPDEARDLVRDARAGVAESNEVRYAVAVDYTDLRVFPTEERAFEDASDREFDQWQATTLRPAQPVLVLCVNGRDDFAYVQAEDCPGWVPLEKLAFCDRGTWLDFVRPQSVAVVTDRLYTFRDGKRSWSCPMGTTLPLVGDKLQLPVRDADGRLKLSTMDPAYGEGLRKGFLPYTRNNIIKMAFKHLGALYGWGNMHKSVDCSGLVQQVYRTMGFFLPRNGETQMLCYPGRQVEGLTAEEKLAALRQQPPGSVLCYTEHITIYLGEEGGVPYMIHASGSRGVLQSDGRRVKEPVMKIVVTPVDIYGGSGRRLLETLEQMNEYKLGDKRNKE